MFAARDEKLVRQGRRLVVIYDALDRSTDDWRTMYRIIRGLLQTALDMRSYRRIRVKMFLRSDQFAPGPIGDFPDASKLLSSAVELTWPRQELYGLLWHLLGKARGVQTASGIRVAELREDYPWMHRLLHDLQGMVVPCRFRDIERRWEKRQTLRRLRDDIEQQDVKLPPRRMGDGADGMREDLQSLSVFQRMLP